MQYGIDRGARIDAIDYSMPTHRARAPRSVKVKEIVTLQRVAEHEKICCGCSVSQVSKLRAPEFGVFRTELDAI